VAPGARGSHATDDATTDDTTTDATGVGALKDAAVDEARSVRTDRDDGAEPVSEAVARTAAAGSGIPTDAMQDFVSRLPVVAGSVPDLGDRGRASRRTVGPGPLSDDELPVPSEKGLRSQLKRAPRLPPEQSAGGGE
jgi:hypothetical protein